MSRAWFNYAFEHPDKVRPTHTALYFYLLDLNNRLGWKEKFGVPTLVTMEASGIRSKTSFLKCLNELEEFGFIKTISKSKNQNSATIIKIIAVSKNGSANSLAKVQQEFSDSAGTGPIDKQVNRQTNKQVNKECDLFEKWWNAYDKKTGKDKAKAKWDKLTQTEKESCLECVESYVRSTPDSQYRKNPLTYLNGKHWEDELEVPTPKQTFLQDMWDFANGPR